MNLSSTMLACCEPNIEYLVGRAGGLFMLCSIFAAALVGLFLIVRDMFRFARQGIPFPLMATIAILFTGLGCVVAGPAALILAPCLLAADLSGRWAVRRTDTGAREDDTSA